MPVPPSPALRESLNAGDTGHIADHEAIAAALNNDTASLSSDQTIAGATTFLEGALLDDGNQFYNVLAHGIVGGGVIDNTAAYATFFAALPRGATAFFPLDLDGYLGDLPTLDTSIRLASSSKFTRLIGTGAGTVVPVDMAVSGEVFQMDRIAIQGGVDALTINAPAYIGKLSKLSDVEILGPSQAGIKVTTGIFSTKFTDGVNVENPGTYGLWVEGAGIANAVELDGFRCTGAGTKAVYWNNTTAAGIDVTITFTNPVIETNEGGGFDCNGIQLVLHSPYFEANGATAGAPDINISNDGASTPRCSVTLYSPYFGPKHASQTDRINVEDAFIDVHLYDVRSSSLSQTVNFNSKASCGYSNIGDIGLAFTAVNGGSNFASQELNRGVLTITGAAWTAYTPTIGAGWALGNGVMTAAYKAIGKTIHWRIVIVWGSTSTFGAGDLTLTLPVAAKDATANVPASGRIVDSSVPTNWFCTTLASTASVFIVKSLGAGGVFTALSNAAPMTWANGDAIVLSGTYEAA